PVTDDNCQKGYPEEKIISLIGSVSRAERDALSPPGKIAKGAGQEIEELDEAKVSEGEVASLQPEEGIADEDCKNERHEHRNNKGRQREPLSNRGWRSHR